MSGFPGERTTAPATREKPPNIFAVRQVTARTSTLGVTIEVVAVVEALHESKKGITMIPALVQFKLSQSVSCEKAQDIFVSSAPK
jgi:hypothetical protein